MRKGLTQAPAAFRPSRPADGAPRPAPRSGMSTHMTRDRTLRGATRTSAITPHSVQGVPFGAPYSCPHGVQAVPFRVRCGVAPTVCQVCHSGSDARSHPRCARCAIRRAVPMPSWCARCAILDTPGLPPTVCKLCHSGSDAGSRHGVQGVQFDAPHPCPDGVQCVQVGAPHPQPATGNWPVCKVCHSSPASRRGAGHLEGRSAAKEPRSGLTRRSRRPTRRFSPRGVSYALDRDARLRCRAGGVELARPDDAGTGWPRERGQGA